VMLELRWRISSDARSKVIIVNEKNIYA